jgi:hypothetical protein
VLRNTELRPVLARDVLAGGVSVRAGQGPTFDTCAASLPELRPVSLQFKDSIAVSVPENRYVIIRISIVSYANTRGSRMTAARSAWFACSGT